MGPTLMDSTSEECRKILRRMELETYGAVVSTLRAQGELNKERRKLLEDLSVLMKISPERHKAEVRRAVNDEKLGCIAERLSGGVDTEWGWALEGRRVVPLMPRLVQPTPFTAMATTVSKMITQNPRICLNQPTASSSVEGSYSGRYVRDPDDEDTLSPVMVPIASPDSSCHSNNNFESDYLEEKVEMERVRPTATQEPQPVHKRPAVPTHPTPKRPRSPTNQVVNMPTPMTKIRAVSPSCVRPPQQTHNAKVVAGQPQSVHLAPRGPALTPVRPTAAAQHASSHPNVPAASGNTRIRVRAPIVHQQGPVQQSQQQQRPVVAVRPPTLPQNAQPNNSVRPVINNNNAASIKQVVQIRSAPVAQLQQQQQQPTVPIKEGIKVHMAATPSSTTAASATAAAVQAVTTSVATTIAKNLPGKANVIVLHKNSPMAKTITAVREGDRSGVAINKASFLPKAMSTPTGATKMTGFPSNVRIITVPSVSGPANSSINTALAQKIVAAQASSGVNTAQKNVYVLEVTNDAAAGKSIQLLGDALPGAAAMTIAELNGVASAVTKTMATPATAVATAAPATPKEVARPAPKPVDTRNEVLSRGEPTDNRPAKAAGEHEVTSGGDPASVRNCGLASTAVKVEKNNGEHAAITPSTFTSPFVVTKESIHTVKLEPGLLDPQTGIIYTESTSRPNQQQSTLDIFSTAIASADLDLEPTAFVSNDEANGSSRLILTTEAFDGPSATSSS